MITNFVNTYLLIFGKFLIQYVFPEYIAFGYTVRYALVCRTPLSYNLL